MSIFVFIELKFLITCNAHHVPIIIKLIASCKSAFYITKALYLHLLNIEINPRKKLALISYWTDKIQHG